MATGHTHWTPCPKNREPILLRQTELPEFLAVSSTNVHSLGYDETIGELHVRFHDDEDPTHYVYRGVPRGVFDSLAEAKSIGGHFHANIKGRYEFAKLEPAQ
jgi:hypothetical protein